MFTRGWLVAASGVAVGTALLLLAARVRGERSARRAWSELMLHGGDERFDAGTVAELPEPARRYLLRAIEPGTPLARSVELTMSGQLVLDPERSPLAMQAEQILAPPTGFVWRARVASGVMRIRGFDLYAGGEGAMRWQLWGLVPVVRARGRDVDRSAAGRLAMEAILMPAVLVPGRGVTWEAVHENRARFVMTVGEETVVTTLDVDPEGRPVRASALRWTADARPEGPGYEVFTVEFEGDLVAGGYTLPGRVVAGWRLGEADEFSFFDARLESAVFR